MSLLAKVGYSDDLPISATEICTKPMHILRSHSANTAIAIEAISNQSSRSATIGSNDIARRAGK
jgi:hypothetical protein